MTRSAGRPGHGAAADRRASLSCGRVGIRGWSHGGSLAAAAVLRRPEVFHVAVAGAGVTDQRLYGAHWRERFLGHPGKFRSGTPRARFVAQAPGLTRPLQSDITENLLAHQVRFLQRHLRASPNEPG